MSTIIRIFIQGKTMPEMVPDRLPANASRGEKEVFSILQNLPDDYIVYYEPVISQRYPKFIQVDA